MKSIQFMIALFASLLMVGAAPAMDSTGASSLEQSSLTQPLEFIKNHPFAVTCAFGVSMIAGAGYYAWRLLQPKPPVIIESVPSPFDVPTKPAQKSSKKWLEAKRAKEQAKKK